MSDIRSRLIQEANDRIYKSFPDLASLTDQDKEDLRELIQADQTGLVIRFDDWTWTQLSGWSPI